MIPEPIPQDEQKWTLRDVFEKKEWVVEEETYDASKPGSLDLNYMYDHGHSPEHDIVLLGRADAGVTLALCGPKEGDEEESPRILCVAGEGHPCAEDSGGLTGWQDLKAVFKKKTKRGEDKERVDWYKTWCANGNRKGLDPYDWDILDVNYDLQKIKV